MTGLTCEARRLHSGEPWPRFRYRPRL